jgi:hypothetical protein
VSTAQAVYAPKSAWRKGSSTLTGTLLTSHVKVPTPSQYFGNSGRNSLRGSAFAQLDLALHKSLPLWSDASRLEFRVEAFNLFNSTNYEYPDSSITDGGNFGAYSSTVVYPSRQVQLALRLSF